MVVCYKTTSLECWSSGIMQDTVDYSITPIFQNYNDGVYNYNILYLMPSNQDRVR
jgi:hypothetical protein